MGYRLQKSEDLLWNDLKGTLHKLDKLTRVEVSYRAEILRVSLDNSKKGNVHNRGNLHEDCS